MSLAMVTPSLMIVGLPHDYSSTTVRAAGPRVTLTAFATASIPSANICALRPVHNLLRHGLTSVGHLCLEVFLHEQYSMPSHSMVVPSNFGR